MPAGKSVHSQGVGGSFVRNSPRTIRGTAWCESFRTYGPCATMLKDITLLIPSICSAQFADAARFPSATRCGPRANTSLRPDKAVNSTSELTRASYLGAFQHSKHSLGINASYGSGGSLRPVQT